MYGDVGVTATENSALFSFIHRNKLHFSYNVVDFDFTFLTLVSVSCCCLSINNICKVKTLKVQSNICF